MSNNLGYSAVLKPGEGVVVVIDGRSYPVPPDAANYNLLVDSLRDGKPAEVIRTFVTPKRAIQTLAKDHGFEVLIDETTDKVEVWCDGQQLGGLIADRIVELVQSKGNFEAHQRFVQKAIQNRDPDAIDQLFKFVENNRCQLHPDGDVLCFKAVRDDYFDQHSGTVSYALGTRVWKLRKDCDPNPSVDCSNGLHVGGRRYVEGFANSNSRILIIKVNPKDFVSVPTYDHGKARVCDLYVYAEIPRSQMDNSLQAFVGIIPGGEQIIKERKGANPREFDATPLQDKTFDKPAAAKKSNKVFMHDASGKKINVTALKKMVAKIGQRAAAKSLGIPRTTIQDWLKAA